jgi:hypothetical protein
MTRFRLTNDTDGCIERCSKRRSGWDAVDDGFDENPIA